MVYYYTSHRSKLLMLRCERRIRTFPTDSERIFHSCSSDNSTTAQPVAPCTLVAGASSAPVDLCRKPHPVLFCLRSTVTLLPGPVLPWAPTRTSLHPHPQQSSAEGQTHFPLLPFSSVDLAHSSPGWGSSRLRHHSSFPVHKIFVHSSCDTHSIAITAWPPERKMPRSSDPLLPARRPRRSPHGHTPVILLGPRDNLPQVGFSSRHHTIALTTPLERLAMEGPTESEYNTSPGPSQCGGRKISNQRTQLRQPVPARESSVTCRWWTQCG